VKVSVVTQNITVNAPKIRFEGISVGIDLDYIKVLPLRDIFSFELIIEEEGYR